MGWHLAKLTVTPRHSCCAVILKRHVRVVDAVEQCAFNSAMRPSGSSVRLIQHSSRGTVLPVQAHRLLWVRAAQPSDDLLVRAGDAALAVHDQHDAVRLRHARCCLPLDRLRARPRQLTSAAHLYGIYACAVA